MPLIQRMPRERLCLIILDGWGIAPAGKGNAITAARPKNFEAFKRAGAYTELDASGNAVGLPPGFIGNSEVGHLHIGAGRMIKQEMVRIDEAITSGAFFRNKVLLSAIKKAKRSRSALHLMGLLSDAGVHSHIRHLIALLKLAKTHKLAEVWVHAFLDGRDSPPRSALRYIRAVQQQMSRLGLGRFGVLVGRYYAMDRDRRWPRTARAYNALVKAEGERAEDVESALKASYGRGITDEFVRPIILNGFSGIKDRDAVIFFNFRSDRARQLSTAFVAARFGHFKRARTRAHVVAMCEYLHGLNMAVAFPPLEVRRPIGGIVARAGLRQFRIAETEKYAHVTYFLNGGREVRYPREDRLLIPSPKVATYDLKPEMSAHKTTEQLLKRIASGRYDFLVINYANPDMVGHTGKFGAVLSAIRAVDYCLGRVVATARAHGYAVAITADHGNAEQMLYPDGTVCTAHTTNRVPFILLANRKLKLRRRGALYNIAPTLLELMGLRKEAGMAASLLV